MAWETTRWFINGAWVTALDVLKAEQEAESNAETVLLATPDTPQEPKPKATPDTRPLDSQGSLDSLGYLDSLTPHTQAQVSGATAVAALVSALAVLKSEQEAESDAGG